MRVFAAGASGALGSRLVPQSIDAGHEVVGTHNSPASAELLRALGAKPVMLDLLDARALHGRVRERARGDRARGKRRARPLPKRFRPQGYELVTSAAGEGT